MRFARSSLLILFLLLLSACDPAPQAEPSPKPVIYLPTYTPEPQHAALLRVAILGDIQDANVWTLFDESGADYWTYIAQAGYWPHLFRLAPQTLHLEPASAISAPSHFDFNGQAYVSTLILRPDQLWTDGSELTAHDVAFTVNTALQFELTGHWRVYYSPDELAFAEALDDSTVRFHFKSKPGVANWQYGALQGPIVNKEFWEAGVAQVTMLLPDEKLKTQVQKLADRLTEVQAQLDDYDQQLSAMNNATREYANLSRQAERVRRERNSLSGNLKVLRDKYSEKITAAQAALFALEHTGEPTLGAWMIDSQSKGVFKNRTNPDTGQLPWFDSVQYVTFADEASAAAALKRDDVDILLTQRGLSANSVDQLSGDANISIKINPTSSARFLAFNQRNPYLSQVSVRQAIACLLDPTALPADLAGQAYPLDAFVLPGPWQNLDAHLPCAGLGMEARLAEAQKYLPVEPIPQLELLAPNAGTDPLRARMAETIASVLNENGIPVKIKLADLDTIMYALYGNGEYDMAIFGWRLSQYPAYLCDWASDKNPFEYNRSRLKSACEALETESDVDNARRLVHDVQAGFSEDVPLLPLYVEARYDAWRNVDYPFDEMLDGLGGLSGAPEFAIPR